MNAKRIKATVYEAITHLNAAKPGRGTATERIWHKRVADEYLATLPAKWWKKLKKADMEIIADVLATTTT